MDLFGRRADCKAFQSDCRDFVRTAPISFLHAWTSLISSTGWGLSFPAAVQLRLPCLNMDSLNGKSLLLRKKSGGSTGMLIDSSQTIACCFPQTLTSELEKVFQMMLDSGGSEPGFINAVKLNAAPLGLKGATPASRFCWAIRASAI